MIFEIYFDTSDKSFIFVEKNMHVDSKNKIIKKSQLIHEFESIYQDVDNYFQKFINSYTTNQ